MTSLQLDKLLTGQVFALLFIFCRVSPVVLLLPGFGETYVSPRMRGTFGLIISFLLIGPLMPIIPSPPAGIPDMVKLLGIEIGIGIFFGSVVRLIMSTLETIGFIIALQTGLSNATVFNPALATQSSLPSAFMSVAGLVLIFATGLDHLMLRSVAATYELFPPGIALPFGDMAQSFGQSLSRSFRIGIELASPFLLTGTLIVVAMGMMQKLMPQVQLFLVMLPVQIYGGLFLLMITIATIMELWMIYFSQTINAFFSR
ncbi:MAG: flagellar biosynthetic protein FliR [Bdellovibrionales bacterium]